MRISRALAMAGLASRRQCEVYVRNGAVTVNGEVVRDLGRQVEPGRDALAYRGKMLEFRSFVYYLLHKPEGYVTTAGDPQAKKTVYELLPHALVRGSRQPAAKRTRVFPVGRLDKDSSGLLLFTNDGDLAYRLTHPKFGVGKWYEVRLDRAFRPEDRFKLLKGVLLEDGMAHAEKVLSASRRILRVLLYEGRNREIRRMMEALEYRVTRLVRIAQGPLVLGTLLPGEGRFLNKREIEALRRAAGTGKEDA
ncbi:MAG: pseudouridine synthase [Candidatus Omnitrophota bacterium]